MKAKVLVLPATILGGSWLVYAMFFTSAALVKLTSDLVREVAKEMARESAISTSTVATGASATAVVALTAAEVASSKDLLEALEYAERNISFTEELMCKEDGILKLGMLSQAVVVAYGECVWHRNPTVAAYWVCHSTPCLSPQERELAAQAVSILLMAHVAALRANGKGWETAAQDAVSIHNQFVEYWNTTPCGVVSALKTQKAIPRLK